MKDITNELLSGGLNCKTHQLTIDGYGSCWVRELGYTDFTYIQEQARKRRKLTEEDQANLIIALSLCNEKGDLLFGKENVGKVKSLPLKFVLSLTEQLMRINYLTPDGEGPLKKS